MAAGLGEVRVVRMCQPAYHQRKRFTQPGTVAPVSLYHSRKGALLQPSPAPRPPPILPFLPAEGSVPYEAHIGANQFTYYVCTHLGGPFSRLPFVTPDQIKAARQIKKLLTGRLESPVSTYPVFPGMHTAKRPRGGEGEKGTPR